MDFIYQQNLDDTALCQEIYDFFKDSPNLRRGIVFNTACENIVNTDRKDSYDGCLNDNPDLFHRYITSLKKVMDEYVDKYPSCNMYAPWGIAEKISVQFYKPGGGYHSWHTERGTGTGYSAARHIVFMTYLNDVTDGGETEFMNQGVKVQPKQGLTVVWPADWTHTHRGITSPTQHKGIVTGWYSYL